MTTDAVILSRVSSTEQEYGKSLDAQTEQGKEYVRKKGLEILKTFRIVESSTKGERKDFSEMMDFIRAQKKSVALIVHTVDRFQRRFNESVELLPLIEKGLLELHFVSNNLIIHKDSPPSDLMMWDFNVVAARAYVLQLKVNTKRGLLKKIEDGEWPTQAPLGYLNYKDGKKKWIKLDPDRAHLIKRLFEEFSTGTYNIRQMHRRMKDLGLRHRLPGGGFGSLVSKNTVYRILENPFYCGTMVVSHFGETKKVKHKYETIISEALFKRCEDIRLGRKKKYFHYGQSPLIFRGLVRCGCGRAITPYIRKGKYIYLKCTRYRAEKFCTNGPVVEAVALDAVNEAINGVQIDSDGAEAIRKYLEEKNKVGFAEQLQEHETTVKAIATNKKKTDTLLEMRMGLLITDEMFKEKFKALEEEKAALTDKQAEKPVNEQDFIVALDEVLYFLSHAGELFKSSQLEGKRIIISSLLANLVLQDKKVNFTYRKPFDIFVKGFLRPIICAERDSNPQAVRHAPLKRTRIPVPPSALKLQKGTNLILSNNAKLVKKSVL